MRRAWVPKVLAGALCTGTVVALERLFASSLLMQCVHETMLGDWSATKEMVMYEIRIYVITAGLWRWEVRSGGALLYCGTAPTKEVAESNAREVVTIA